MHDFTPLRGLLGGALIGLAASLLLLGSGRIAGVSGITAGALFSPDREARPWRVAFLAGLVAAGVPFVLLEPGAIAPSPRPLLWLAIAGVLVGVGTRLGSGCTSGHGVCGVSRLSPRSLVATALFVATGMLTVAVWRLVGEGAP